MNGWLSASGVAARVAYIPPRESSSADTSSDGTRTSLCAGNATSGDNVHRDDANVPANNAPLLPTYSITDNSLVHCFFSLALARVRRVSEPSLGNRCISFARSPSSRGTVYLFLTATLTLTLLFRSFSPPPPFAVSTRGNRSAEGCTWDLRCRR